MSQQGQLIQQDFFDNVGGLNTSDSPFKVGNNQATSGTNYDYTQTGGIRKRLGHQKVNSSADAQLKTLGLGQYNSSSGTKFAVRAAGTKIQNVNLDTPTFTNLSEDTTTAGTDFLATGSTVPVKFQQFNGSLGDVLWGAGGGMSAIYGAYSTSKATKNGVAAPTGAISAAVTNPGGAFISTGTYRYAVAFRKAATQAISNVALEISATVAATSNTVTITLSGITNIDTTKYDKIYIYRSAVGGATGFTTGDLIAQVNSNVTSYADVGTSIASSQNIPRSGNSVLDNSQLEDGTYKVITSFKRRLVTAKNSTLYLSDLNKSESWPATNTITVPSGGPITALGVVSFTSPQAQSLEEILVIFKEREVWVLTGDSVSDWVLKFIDNVGCPSQPLLVSANGFLYWMDYRGVYMWDGTSKPTYCSRPIEPLFARNGDINKQFLNIAHGEFLKKENQIIWYLTHRIYGEQKFSLKLDLRLTLPQVSQDMTGRMLDGVFIQDSCPFAIYASNSMLPSSAADELLLLGDSSGYIYQGYNLYADGGSAYSFTYGTKFLDLGSPGTDKRYHKVIVWVTELGNWNLKLDYWTGYTSPETQKSTLAEPVSTINGQANALWDLGYWDVAFWDDVTLGIKPLVFNLNSGFSNSNEGDCIRLQFRNENANEPITISGFSVIYSMKGLAK